MLCEPETGGENSLYLAITYLQKTYQHRLVVIQMIMMSIVPPVALGAVAYGRFVSKIARKTTHATADLTKLAEGGVQCSMIHSKGVAHSSEMMMVEKLSSVRTVRAFAQEDREIQTFNQRVETVYELAMREARASGVFFGGVRSFSLCRDDVDSFFLSKEITK